MRLRRELSKFFRSLRNKIRESLKKEGMDATNVTDKFNDRLTETHSDTFKKVTEGGKKGFRAVVGFLKIKF